MLHFLFVKQADELPGLIVPEKLLPNAREILAYWQHRLPHDESLIPEAHAADINALIERFYWKTGLAVRRWAYYYMLPDRRGTLRSWHRGAPAWEKVVSWICFPIMRAMMSKLLKLTPTAPPGSDGGDRRHLPDDRGAVERRAPLPHRRSAHRRRYDLRGTRRPPRSSPTATRGRYHRSPTAPAAMRAQVLRLRQTVAGQFALRLYREDRGQQATAGIVPATGIGAFFKRLTSVITGSPLVLRSVFGLLDGSGQSSFWAKPPWSRRMPMCLMS